MEFVNYNANPKNKKTSDCVIRAICTALEVSWEQVYKEMLDVALRTGYAISSKQNYTKYLSIKGYEKQKMPRRNDNSRYTIKEFIDELADPNKTYIIDMANHVTVASAGKLYYIWNCGSKSVGNYWVLNYKIKPEDKPTKKKSKRVLMTAKKKQQES